MFTPEERTKDGYLKHVYQEGSREHVISYSTVGLHCSEKECVINRDNSFPGHDEEIFLND